MPEKRSTNSAIQNRKKITPILYLVFLFVGIFQPIYAQEIEYGREINEYNGLVSNVTRTTHTDKNGAVWVGTDAGLNVFPNHNKAHQKICAFVKNTQIWAISQQANQLYIGTFDSGLYLFALNSGNLIKHWNSTEMPRIRRIRKIKEVIYIVHGIGVNQIASNTDRPLYNLPLVGLEKKDFPTDVFTINGRLHVSFYITKAPYRLAPDGRWVSTPLFRQDKDSLNNKKILCAKEINGKTYIGLFSNHYVVYDQGKYEVYKFTFDRYKELAPWNVDGIGPHVYFAIGNNIDVNNGYFWKHNPSQNKTIKLGLLDERKYAWGVTVDEVHKGVWFSTITNGAYFQPHRAHWIKIPGGYHDMRMTRNYTIAWNSFQMYIKHKSQTFWSTFPISSSILDIVEHSDTLYFINNHEFLRFSKTDKKPIVIEADFYQKMLIHQNKLYLFRLFGQTDYFDFKTQKRIINFNPKLHHVVNTAQNQRLCLLQLEDLGYFLLENNSLIPLKTDLKSDITKNRIFFCENYLITQVANTLRLSRVNRFTKKIKTYQHINLNKLFPNLSIEWIKGQGSHIWLGNSSNAFRFTIDKKTHQMVFDGQFYLGQSPLSFEPVQIVDGYIYKKGKGEIIVIPTNKANILDFQAPIEFRLTGTDLNFRTIATRTWEGQLLSLSAQSNNYLVSRYSHQLLEIWNTTGLLERKIISLQRPYTLDNFPRGLYNLNVGTNNIQQHLIFRINQSIFYNIGFWLILLITLLLLGYVVFKYQREKLSLNQKIVSLQLSTLKANLNPHFIFNIMNLIQSLIVKSEKAKALKATSDLGILNRLFLETSNKDLITLEEELDFASKYMGLEKMRFEEDAAITFEIKIHPKIQIREWFIPPLILQPLLENALKHSHYSDDAPQTPISIQITNLEPHQLHINITNSLPKNPGQKPPGTNLGISLVEDRLALLNERYQYDYHAYFRSYKDLKGLFVATITIEKRNIAWMVKKD
jgi:hypothetical protein